MNATDDEEEITELTTLAAEKVSGVGAPANGTPWLFLKSIDLSRPPVTPPTATPTKEKRTVKSPKGAKKLLKAQKREQKVRKSAVDAVKAYATARTLRLNALERAVKSTPSDVGLQYLLAKEQILQGRQDDGLRARALPPLDQASAIRAAAAPAIANALGAAINGPHDPRRSLVSAFRGDYNRLSPADLPGGDPTLPSLRLNHQADTEIRDLSKQLKKAASPEERERVGYALTRARLVEGHRRGVI
jgi:hypothetical protein